MSTTEVQPRGTKPLRSTPASKQASTKVKKTPKGKGALWWTPAGLANHGFAGDHSGPDLQLRANVRNPAGFP